MAREDWIPTADIKANRKPATFRGTDADWRAMRARVLTGGDLPMRVPARSSSRRGREESRAAESRALAEAEHRDRVARAEASAEQWIDDLLRKIDADEANEERAREAHEKGRVGFSATTNPWAAGHPEARATTAGPKIKVTGEPKTYGFDPAASWVADRVVLRMAAMGGAHPFSRNFSAQDAERRLKRYDEEVRADLLTGSDNEERARILRCISEQYRGQHGTNLDFSRRDRLAIIEQRAGSTGAGSLGALVPPAYLVGEFVKWRSNFAALASQATPFDLPPTGMTVYVPNVTADGFAMAVQTENEALATSSTTAGYIEAPVLTIAGSVKASQQLFSRIGPGLTFDMFVARQAAVQAATVLDQQAISAVVAGAGTITNSGSPSVGGFLQDVAKAAQEITTTDGTVLPATHVFLPSPNAKWLMSQLDLEDRPVWSPAPAGTMARAGAVGSRSEGATGYSVLGADVYEDNSLPTTGPSATYATVLVCNVPDALWVGTSELQVDVWPETDAASLSVVVNARQYAAIAVLYPSAFVTVSGAAYVTPTFSAA